MRTHRTARWTIGLLATLALLGVPRLAAADQKLYECQHPVRTGEEAYHLHAISVKAACAAVLKLGQWEYRDHHISQLYGCRYPNGAGQAGYPYLRMHRFDGYHLSISSQWGFVMSRGRSSFSVTGTDFPLNCS